MTTLLHISDTHLGKRQYRSERRRQDFAAAFDQAIDIALGEHDNHDNDPVDAVVHTGDLFDDSEARLRDMHECQRILQRLADEDIPFYAIIGNHERKLTTQFLDLYGESNLAIRLDTTPTMINGDIALYGIDAVRRRAWETTDFSLTEPDADQCVSIVCMHQLFSPPIDDGFLAEYELEPVIGRFDMDIDGMALGDYHKRCSATVDDVTAWYPGSTERCALDETEDRSVDLIEVDLESDPKFVRRRLTLNTPSFERITVRFSEGDGIQTVKAELDSVAPFDDDAVVIVTMEGENVSVTKQQVYQLLDSYEVDVTKVRDNRELTTFASSNDTDDGDGEVKDIETAIEDELSDRMFSDRTQRIEDIVRNTDETAKSNVENEVDRLLDEEGDEE